MLIEGLKKLLANLDQRTKQALASNRVSVVVGYTAKAAVHVHENIEERLRGIPRPSGISTYWAPGGSKFLERPARELAPVLGSLIAQTMKAGVKLPQALLRAGMLLQRESQLLVPVEFGMLKASAFTRLETA